uniref:Uncharacterized protein LOC108053587 n=1 Tax=Drosophila rhopaloa TaxID=1041015 RepID=A0A6P4G2M7_DRORH
MDDKDAYEICCKLRKRQKEDNIARKRNQPVLFEKRTNLYATPTLIAQRSLPPLTKRPVIVKKIKPRWREEHEVKLQEKDDDQELERQKFISHNLKKREGLDKFHHLFDSNQNQTARRTPEWQKNNSPYYSSSETLKPKSVQEKKKPKQTARRNLEWQKKDSSYYSPSETLKPKSVQEKKKAKLSSAKLEQNLLQQFFKNQRPVKDLKGIRRVETPFGRYQKNEKNREFQSSDLFGQMLKKAGVVIPELHPTLRSRYNLKVASPYQDGRGDADATSFEKDQKSVQYTKLFSKMLKGKASKTPELHPLLKSSNRLNVASSTDFSKIENSPKELSTKVGAKFSWAFRKMIKKRRQPETKIFKDLIKDSDVEMPELIPALRSRIQFAEPQEIKKNEEANKTGLKKSTLKLNLIPNYGLRSSETYRQMKV